MGAPPRPTFRNVEEIQAELVALIDQLGEAVITPAVAKARIREINIELSEWERRMHDGQAVDELSTQPE